jgi:threonine/homoserine/homoserine lactone efflux protein
MGEGRRAGIALALGIATGSVLWALLTAAGLSALLASYSAALTVIKIALSSVAGLQGVPRRRVCARHRDHRR